MTPFFKRYATLIADRSGMRLIALGLAQAGVTWVGCAFVVALVGMLTGCASLPDSVQRPVSQARTDVADTRLAAVAAASTPEGGRQLSGMRLLPAGDQAFEARIALACAQALSQSSKTATRCWLHSAGSISELRGAAR